MTKYPVTIHGTLGAYGAIVPDMPGLCCAMGDTVDEVLANIEDSLADFVELMEEDGEVVPPPSPIESIPLEPGEMIGYVALRTPVAT